jgi:hypothetical protein
MQLFFHFEKNPKKEINQKTCVSGMNRFLKKSKILFPRDMLVIESENEACERMELEALEVMAKSLADKPSAQSQNASESACVHEPTFTGTSASALVPVSASADAPALVPASVLAPAAIQSRQGASLSSSSSSSSSSSFPADAGTDEANPESRRTTTMRRVVEEVSSENLDHDSDLETIQEPDFKFACKLLASDSTRRVVIPFLAGWAKAQHLTLPDDFLKSGLSRNDWIMETDTVEGGSLKKYTENLVDRVLKAFAHEDHLGRVVFKNTKERSRSKNAKRTKYGLISDSDWGTIFDKAEGDDEQNEHDSALDGVL